jgi:DGQHR domain-containing protein
MNPLTITARRVKQGKVSFFETAIAAGNLTDKDAYRVDSWNFATGEGYQREINPQHARKLTHYLEQGDEHSNLLPANIVINFRNPIAVKELGNGMVELTIQQWPGYIIDGQHRVQAATKAIEEGSDLTDYEFGVTITNFTVEEEMVHFRNLNYTANRPPKGLGQTITSSLNSKFGWVPKSWSEQAQNRAVTVTMKLATDIESPWYGKIALGGIRKRSYHTTVQSSFVKTLEPLFVTGRFSDPNEKIEHVYELINGFWKAVGIVWPEAMDNPQTAIIQRLGGFATLNRLMGRIFSSINVNASQEEIVALLQQIRENLGVDERAWGYGAGMIKNLRAGYSENKANSVVTDFLWSGISFADRQ